MKITHLSLRTVLASICLVACNKSPELRQAPTPPAVVTLTPAEQAADRGAQSAAPTPPTHAAVKTAEHAAPDGMVYVPAGSFDMGLPKEITHGEGPKRTKVEAFFIDRTEVTVVAYLACVQHGECTLPPHQTGCSATAKNPLLDHPMNCVTKKQAEHFCKAQDKRLPTESEWEFAARGTDGRHYPWGTDEAGEQLCWQGRAGAEAKRACPVGSFPDGASPFGALDMAGNVAEWTSSPETERGLPGLFLIRGGSYRLTEGIERAEPWNYEIRSDRHESVSEDESRPTLGFRCAKNA